MNSSTAANFSFKKTYQDTDSGARAGILRTAHGEIQTPVFMPVGTQANVKLTTKDELELMGSQVILSNAYHLYLRPGIDLIEKMGGLHKFMGWKRPILTDSGGYQIFSLNEPKKINLEGLSFKSHLDGSSHFLTPEDVVEIQRRLGVDIMMPLDVCIAYPAEEAKAKEAMDITHQWLERSCNYWQTNISDQHLFGIVQGSSFADLRRESARVVSSMPVSGIAIGGLSVGEPQSVMVDMLDAVIPELPNEKPRYLMGVGYPKDLVLAVERGVDMFDCVVPTRNGRNGTVFTWEGKFILQNSEFMYDEEPIDKSCPCYVCKNHSRSYLRHLFQSGEMLGLRLASLHNLTFFIQLLNTMRSAILEGRFQQFKTEFFNRHRKGYKNES